MMSSKVCAYIILLCIQIAMTVDLPKKKPIDPREVKWSGMGPLETDDTETHDPWLSDRSWQKSWQYHITKTDEDIIKDSEELDKLYNSTESKNWYFNPVGSTWQKITAKRLSEKELAITKHKWRDVGKPLSDKVVNKTVMYNDGYSLVRTLSFWLTGTTIYHHFFRLKLEHFMKVDQKAVNYIKAVKRDYINLEVQCAAFLLNTSIMVFDQNNKIWQMYFKDLDNKRIDKEERCIYVRLVNKEKQQYDIVIGITNEIDTRDSFERMHIQDSIMSYLPDSPYKEPWKQLSTIEGETSNSGPKEHRKEELKKPAYCYKRVVCHDNNDVTTDTSAQEIETNKWFIPVDADWQKKIMKKLKLPEKILIPHDDIEKKKLNSYPIIKAIRGDGNCLFRSISFWTTGSEDKHKEMRKLIVDFMKTDERITNYFDGPAKRDSYLRASMMAEDGHWGTEIEIIAAAMLLETSIYVFTQQYQRWILYNRDIENQNKPGEDEMCIYIRNEEETHYDIVIDIGSKEMYQN